MRRSPALPAVLAAVLFLAGPMGLVRAAGITYSLVNNTGSPLSSADIEVTPVGSLLPPPPQGTAPTPQNPGPMTIVGPIPAGFNFDPNSGGSPLQVAMGTAPGATFDALVFSFVATEAGYSNKALPSGDALDFTLNTVPGFHGALGATLFDPPKGLSLKVINPGGGDNTPPTNVKPHHDPPPQNTPEPLSVVLWSTLAGASLVRARKLRRAARLG